MDTKLRLAEALNRHKMKRQSEKLLSILGSIDGLKVEGCVGGSDLMVDIEKIWRQVILIDTLPSASMLLSESQVLIDDWLRQRVAFLDIRSTFLLSVGSYGLLPLLRVELSFNDEWIAPLRKAVQRDSGDFDVILVNPEQTRLLAFIESEYEIQAFEWLLQPESGLFEQTNFTPRPYHETGE